MLHMDRAILHLGKIIKSETDNYQQKSILQQMNI